MNFLPSKLSAKETKAIDEAHKGDEARKGTHLSREALAKRVLLQMLGEHTIEEVKKRNAENA